MRSPAVEFVLQHSELNTRLLKKMESQLSAHGISFTEFLILHHLNKAPGSVMRRIELAESVGITASGITRLLAPMEKTGLVEKESNPRDARVSLVKLSKTGQKLYAEAAISFDYGAEQLTEKISINQLNTLIELMKKLA